MLTPPLTIGELVAAGCVLAAAALVTAVSIAAARHRVDQAPTTVDEHADEAMEVIDIREPVDDLAVDPTTVTPCTEAPVNPRPRPYIHVRIPEPDDDLYLAVRKGELTVPEACERSGWLPEHNASRWCLRASDMERWNDVCAECAPAVGQGPPQQWATDSATLERLRDGLEKL